MATEIGSAKSVPWWKEPTKDQWLAWWAAWLGWTLDAFDFTVFLLIMVPISQEFGVPLTAVTAVFATTLWLRLLGATASGWLADRIGRKTPLMISIAWYSLCNFIAGFAPSFWFLFLFRALLGIGMGAEWPAGASLAMESWPARSRGLMSGDPAGLVEHRLPAVERSLRPALRPYRLARHAVDRHPAALSLIYVRYFVKEPEVWLQNRRLQREQKREVRAPLLSIFKRGLLGNTLTACWWMASGFVVYYSLWALFATHLQKDLHLSPALVAMPIALANLVAFLASGFWGWTADRIGRRWSMIIPAAIGIFVAPLYLLTTDFTWIAAGFILQGMFAGAIYGQNPSYLCERFPTEVRGTASGFCYHQGAIWGGFVAPIVTFFAINHDLGFAIPMLVGTVVGSISFIIALLLGPETKGKVLVPDLVVT